MKEKIWMVALLVITALISAAMLAVINIKTAPVVAKNNEIKQKKCVLDVFNVKYDDSNVESVFDEKVQIVSDQDAAYYRLKQVGGGAGGDSSIAFSIVGPGFWGPISAFIAMRSDRETIEGLKFLKHDETPGLGGRIDEEWFYSQFMGKKIKPKLVKMPNNMAKADNEFDAITGATQTSMYVEALINNGVTSFMEKLE